MKMHKLEKSGSVSPFSNLPDGRDAPFFHDGTNDDAEDGGEHEQRLEDVRHKDGFHSADGRVESAN